MNDRPIYPFTAIVGQDLMKKSLLLNAINLRIGGVLIRGQKGTAKSTAVRAFARLLPELAIVGDCLYSCDPDDPSLCADCAARRSSGAPLLRAQRQVPMVELPVGATEDRVIGTLNLEQAIREGTRAFEPGLLAAANRGILYVDEVNLLSNHLVDVLLDAAAMGHNYVEREGVSASHPAQFILVGTMNPEEGDLRPQLLDRFALAVEATGLRDPQDRAEVVRRRIAFEQDPAAFVARWQDEEERERARIVAARALLPSVQLREDLLALITNICAALKIDGLRGDIVLYKTALALAAYAGRTQVEVEDIREAAELGLAHRRRRQPFDRPEADQEQLDDLIRQHAESQQSDGEGADARDEDVPHQEQPARGAHLPGTAGILPAPDTTQAGETPAVPGSGRGRNAEQIFQPGPVTPLRPLPSPGPGRERPTAYRAPAAGRRAYVEGDGPSGRYVRAQAPRPGQTVGSLALDATLRAAAPFQLARRRERPDGPRLLIVPADLREKVRETETGNLILFLVDASGSMAARQRMVAVKGAILSLLVDAYQKRDRVGLIAFRGESASIILPPTSSIELAERQLRTLPTGGRTPLAHGLHLGNTVIAGHQAADPGWTPWLILVSDGRPNVPLHGTDALAGALGIADDIRIRGIHCLVIDTEAGPVRLGLNRQLAERLGARCVRLDDLAAGHLATAVRRQLDNGVSS